MYSIVSSPQSITLKMICDNKKAAKTTTMQPKTYHAAVITTEDLIKKLAIFQEKEVIIKENRLKNHLNECYM